MPGEELMGWLLALLAGVSMGTSPWPLRRMKTYKYEHFAPISMLVALLLAPWVVTVLFCPAPFAALRAAPAKALTAANSFSIAFGLAQVLAIICFLRIGVSLTYGILTGVGATVGALIPLVFKGSGPFAGAPDLFSMTGLVIVCGAGVMLAGILLATVAGFGRERATLCSTSAPGGFRKGWLMAVLAGVCSAGLLFVLVYGGGPIKEAVLAQGAPTLAAGLSVWSFGLFGAAAVNLLYPLWLAHRNGSWRVFTQTPGDALLAAVYGLQFFTAIALMGQGAILLKELGASVGWGTQQGTQILAGQLLGFANGEWKGVEGRPRLFIYAAMALLVAGIGILGYTRLGGS